MFSFLFLIGIMCFFCFSDLKFGKRYWYPKWGAMHGGSAARWAMQKRAFGIQLFIFFAYIAHPCNYIIFVHPCLIGTYSRYCVPDMNYGLPVIGVANIGTTVGAMKYEQSFTQLLHLLRSSLPVTFSPLCHLYLSPLSLSCFLFLYISVFVVFSLYCLLSPFTCLYLALFLDLIFIFL